MHARHYSLFPALFVVVSLLGFSGARATVITASYFTVGTNITNAISGFTLNMASHPYGYNIGFDMSDLVVGSHTVTSAGGDTFTFNTLGSATGGNAYSSGYMYPPFSAFDSWDMLYAVFSTPVTGVTVNSFSESGDNTFIYAFDPIGGFIGESSTQNSSCVPAPIGSISSCFGVDQTESFTAPSSQYVGAILVGSLSSASYITELDTFVGSVPEPGTIALFAGGLLAMGIAISRRRRRRRPVDRAAS